MGKAFKLRLSLPSLRICRSKKPSSLPKSPSKTSATKPKVFDITCPKLPAPHPTANQPSIKLKMLPTMSGCVSKFGSFNLNSLTNNNNADSAALPRLCNSPVSEDHDETPTPWPMSFSSADQEGDDNDDESEGLLSSCSSFDSSSDFGYSLKTIEEMQAYVNNRREKKGKAKKSIKRFNSNSWKDGQKTTMAALPENDHSSPEKKTNRLMPAMVDGKVNESYAVMKKSEDPYDDFKKSMMEMILEKHLSESVDLENLLRCFLSLNSKEHHEVIVEAFGEVWEELFSSKSKC